MKQFIMMKRVLACLLISALITALAAASAFADLSLISQGEACLQAEPPEYEEAAQLFRRAGLQGDGEGYYRLAKMYDDGLLVIGNPCTDDCAWKAEGRRVLQAGIRQRICCQGDSRVAVHFPG